MRCPGQGAPSARETTIGQGFPSPYQPDKGRSAIYPTDLGPNSCWYALCATIVGNWREPSGESRFSGGEMNNIRFLRAVLWPSLRPYFSSPLRLVRLPVRVVRLLRMHGLRGLRDALVQRATMRRFPRFILTHPGASFTKPHSLILPENYPFKQIVTEISSNDDMFNENIEHYLKVGLSALNNIETAISKRGLAKVRTILDMPCGHGRVTRVLRAAYPDTDLYVCDLDTDGVQFCAENFGAKPLTSNPDFNAINFHLRFDLIWVGSLITHLPANATAAFLDFLLRHLTDEGVAIVSSHGSFVAGRIQNMMLQGAGAYSLPRESAEKMLADYFEQGYGYGSFADFDLAVQDYGTSLVSRDWLISETEGLGGKVLYYADHAWDRHHDIVAFVSTAEQN